MSEIEPRPAADRASVAGWRAGYDEARRKLLAGDFLGAAKMFAELERTAPSDEDRAAARAQRELADEWAHRGVVIEPGTPPPPADKRSTDEIVSLYLTGALYGIGGGAFLVTLLDPDSIAGGTIPGLALTGGALFAIAAADNTGRPLRYGVAQSIVTGAFIGLEHGFIWGQYYETIPRNPFSEAAAAGVLVGGATLGAAGGALVGTAVPVTPGRAGWVGSTTLWSGSVLGLGVAALIDKERPAFAAAGIGLALGMPAGMLTAGSLSPSIWRVRLIDLSAILGGLAGSGAYSAIADNWSSQSNTGVSAIGIGIGFAAGVFATSWMTPDPLRRDDEKAAKSPSRALASVHPVVTSSSLGSMMIGAGGSLD